MYMGTVLSLVGLGAKPFTSYGSLCLIQTTYQGINVASQQAISSNFDQVTYFVNINWLHAFSFFSAVLVLNLSEVVRMIVQSHQTSPTKSPITLWIETNSTISLKLVLWQYQASAVSAYVANCGLHLQTWMVDVA